jgi:hypothetical protein
MVQRRGLAAQRGQRVERVEHGGTAPVASGVRRHDLATRHDHDAIDIALDCHRLEGVGPRDAVPIAVEGDGLILVHPHGGPRDAGSKGRLGSCPAAAPSSAKRAAIRNGPDSDWTVRPCSARQSCRKLCVQGVEVSDPRHGGGEATLDGLDGPLGVGLLIAVRRPTEERVEGEVAGQRGRAGMELTLAALEDPGGDHPGVVPPDLAGRTAEEIEGGDQSRQDGLGAFGGQGQDEGIIGVGPDGDQDGGRASPVGEIDVEVAEVGLEAVARGMGQRDEGLAVSPPVLEQVALARIIQTGSNKEASGCV